MFTVTFWQLTENGQVMCHLAASRQQYFTFRKTAQSGRCLPHIPQDICRLFFRAPAERQHATEQLGKHIGMANLRSAYSLPTDAQRGEKTSIPRASASTSKSSRSIPNVFSCKDMPSNIYTAAEGWLFIPFHRSLSSLDATPPAKKRLPAAMWKKGLQPE